VWPGFIGSHLTEALGRQGYNVRASVLYNFFNFWGWLDRCAPDVKGKFEVITGTRAEYGLLRWVKSACNPYGISIPCYTFSFMHIMNIKSLFTPLLQKNLRKTQKIPK